MKQTVKRVFAVLLALCLLLPLLPTGAEAANTVVYDAASYSRFQRSASEVAQRYFAAVNAGPSYVDGQTSSYYSTPASTVSPYHQGVLTDDTLKTMEASINFLRWLAGSEPLKYAVTQNDTLQCGALVRNFDFSHTISNDNKKPADMSQSLWNKGKGVDNTLLSSGPTPMEAIFSWVNEGYNLNTGAWLTYPVGHRMNLLEYRASRIDLGYCGRVGIGNNAAYANTVSLPFIAYPAPGPMPNEIVYARRSCWSVELNTSTLSVSDESALKVTVTNVGTGESYVCTSANGKLKYHTWRDPSYEINFVQPPCDSNTYAAGSVYQVVVTGLKDKATGKDAELRYQVEFFAAADYEAREYDITMIIGAGGDAACTSSTAKAGEEILVAAYPQNGYRVDSITWTPEGGSTTDITQTRKFTMPAANVTIIVSFAPAPMYELTLNVGPNGGASLSKTKASAGQEIIVETAPDETYRVDKITWTAEGGSPVDITASGRFTMPEARVSVEVSFKHVNPFVDVPDTKYYADAVLWAYYHDPQVTSGINDDHFGPNNKCTREQIMTFIWKALGAPEPASAENPFTDVNPNKWYAKPILWAVENGVTGGLNPTTFGVGKPCNRAQVVTFLYTAAGKPPVEASNNPFTDVKETDYFYSAVLWAVENGITGGTTPTTFSPKQTCTRAQVVTFLYKAMTNPDIAFCDHSYRVTEHTDPSCTEAEHETKICTKCGCTVSRSIGAALGHDGVFVRTYARTAEEDGYDLYHCNRCGVDYQMNIQEKVPGIANLREVVE